MRSAKLMNGRVFAGARALYRAAGVDGKDFGKPIIAIANSFDEFLPGHVHLNKVGRLISDAIKEAGGIPREFNMMTASPWATPACCIPCRAATSSPIPWNIR